MQSRLQSSLQTGLQSDYAKSTSSFFSNILTSTTSKYNTLRRQLISSEADGETEDDSHIARGLRAYYTEKGRAFPDWLPPDPKAPPPPPPTQFVSSSGAPLQQQQQPQYGQPQQNAGGGRWGRSGGGLGDLWGDNKNQAPAGESLRQRPGMMSNNSSQSGPPGSGSAPSGSGRFGGSRLGDGQQLEPQSRPLPSQRAGSYQSQASTHSSGGRFDTATPPPSSGGGTAQDRLKARLWGAGRSASPSQEPQYAPPQGGRSNYDSGSGGRNPYSTGGSSQQSAPMASSNSPWTGGGDPYAGGGQNYGQQDGRPQGGGLPSGPRSGRQGLGLPSGPRPQRF